MQKYRVAIVGLGRMASTIDDEVRDYSAITLPYSIAASCQEIDKIDLVAGADILPEKLLVGYSKNQSRFWPRRSAALFVKTIEACNNFVAAGLELVNLPGN